MRYKLLSIFFLLLVFLPLTVYWSLTAWLSWGNPNINDWFSIPLFGFIFIIVLVPLLVILLIAIAFHSRSNVRVSIENTNTFLQYRITRIVLILVMLLPMFWSTYRFRSQPNIVPPKLLVLGLDGGSWPIINRLIDEEKLYAIRDLVQYGASGTLKSIEPSRSPLLWTTMATGLEPKEHGVSGFFSTRADLKAPRVWDIAQAKGLKVGLYGWIVTWPPESAFSFCIPSWLARSPETYPLNDHFIQEIHLEQALLGGNVRPASVLWDSAKHGAGYRSIEKLAKFYWRDRSERSDEEHMADKMLSEVRFQTDMFLSLLRKHSPDVATFTLYGTDKLAHRFWHHAYPDQFHSDDLGNIPKYKTVIEDYYIEADRAFHRILREVGDSTTVMLVSDHGMRADPALPRQFFLDIPKLLSALGVENLFQYQTIQRRFRLEPVIDDPTLLDEVQKKLESVKMDDTVFSVEQADGGLEFRTAFSLSWHEDSPILQHETITINGESFPTKRLFFVRTFSGTHDPNGIIAMKGPPIGVKARIDDADLYDLAPTMLYTLGLPVGQNMKGRVLEDAFQQEWVEQNPVDFIERYDVELPSSKAGNQDGSLIERLKNVGYVK